MNPMPQPATQPAPVQQPINVPLVLLAWGVLIYTWFSSWIQPAQAKPLPLISAWLQPALHVPQHTWCLFKGLTHLPCFFCGLTRSFVLIGKGEWQASFQYHMLGIPIYMMTLGIAVFGLIAPRKTSQVLAFLCQRRSLAVVALALSLCWFWKLSQAPRFW